MGQPHLSDGNTEAQRGEVPCSRSHSQNSNPRLSNSVGAPALSRFTVKPPENHRRCSGPTLPAKWCGAHRKCQGVFISECRSRTRACWRLDAFRRWQRVLGNLAMHTLLTWPFGVRLSPLEGVQGPRGACLVFGGPDLEKGCESSKGRVPASPARSVGTACQAATAAAATPLPPVPPALQQPGEGLATSPVLS